MHIYIYREVQYIINYDLQYKTLITEYTDCVKCVRLFLKELHDKLYNL